MPRTCPSLCSWCLSRFVLYKTILWAASLHLLSKWCMSRRLSADVVLVQCPRRYSSTPCRICDSQHCLCLYYTDGVQLLFFLPLICLSRIWHRISHTSTLHESSCSVYSKDCVGSIATSDSNTRSVLWPLSCDEYEWSYTLHPPTRYLSNLYHHQENVKTLCDLHALGIQPSWKAKAWDFPFTSSCCLSLFNHDIQQETILFNPSLQYAHLLSVDVVSLQKKRPMKCQSMEWLCSLWTSAFGYNIEIIHLREDYVYPEGIHELLSFHL